MMEKGNKVRTRYSLRPRQRVAPADHNYCFVPGLPVYDLRQTPRSYGVGSSFAYRHQAPTRERSRLRRRKMSKQQIALIRQKKVYSYSKKPRRLTKGKVKLEKKKTIKKKVVTEGCKMVDKSEKTKRSNDDGAEASTSTHTNCSMCSSCGKRWKRFRHSHDDEERRHSRRLVVKNFKLPFDQLPVVVKLRIFEYLSPQERGLLAVVCKEWAYLLRSPRLWAKLDLACFNPPVQRIKHHPNAKPFQFSWFTTVNDYVTYKQRMLNFFEFLRDLEPRLSSFSMCFDISSERDQWLKLITDLLDHCQCRDLTRLAANWTLTPVQPPCMETFCCLFNKVRHLVHLHFARVRKFYLFLEKITRKMCHLQCIQMPFDWSPRSVLLLCRLTHLQSLSLQRYINMRCLSQELLETVLRALPDLHSLTLEVVQPVFSSRQTYKLEHQQLRTLDLSGSKGFFLHKLVTPQLRVFRTSRHPWHGPLVARSTNCTPCLYELLRQGAPQLTQISKHKLHPYWLEYMYEELDLALERICPCKYHWTDFRAANPQNNVNAANAYNENAEQE